MRSVSRPPLLPLLLAVLVLVLGAPAVQGDLPALSPLEEDWATEGAAPVFSAVTEEELAEMRAFEPAASSDAAFRHFQRAVRFLMGSNCVLIERGEVPIYEQCYGCSMREAFACLQDMRNNVTGNVPVGCRIESISEKPDTSCCPTFNKRTDGTFGPVLFESSAYPMAFECLKEVGCEDTEIFTNLMAECYYVCDGVKNLYNNDIYFTCTAIPSPASSVSSSVFVVATALALSAALQLLY